MAANPLANYLVRLTSRQAFQLFLVAFILGFLSLWYDVGVPVVPVAIVVIYGMTLFVSAKYYLVSHSEMTNNSPYFLGFLFFLSAIFIAFSRTNGTLDNVNTGILLRELGAALLTTVIGLPFRQLLFAYAPAQLEQDTFYRSLEEELRRSASAFRKSQAELLEVLKTFVETRESLFVEEEKASKKYVKSLSKAVASFDTISDTYPDLISSNLERASAAVMTMKNRLESLVTATNQINPQFVTQMQPYIENIKVSFSKLDEISQQVATSLRKAGDAANAVPQEFTTAAANIRQQGDQLREDLKKRLEVIGKDLGEVDSILTEFIGLTVDRISQLR